MRDADFVVRRADRLIAQALIKAFGAALRAQHHAPVAAPGGGLLRLVPPSGEPLRGRPVEKQRETEQLFNRLIHLGAQRRDVLTSGDVTETERDALGNVSEGAGPLDEAGGPAATAKGRPSRPDAPEGGLGDKLSQPAGDRRAAAAMLPSSTLRMKLSTPRNVSIIMPIELK